MTGDSNTITAPTERDLSSAATSTATASANSAQTPKWGQEKTGPSALAAELSRAYDDIQAKKSAEAAPTRGSDGKFVKAAAPQQNTQAAKPVETPAEKPVVATKDPEATAREERALTALRRAKVPKSVLDGLDYDTRLQWGTDLAEGQSKTDTLLRTKGAAETRTEPDKGTPAKADPEAALPPVAADLNAATAKLAESLAFDDAGQKQIEAFAKAVQAPLIQHNAQISQALQAAHAHVETLERYVSDMAAEGARSKLVSEIPELADKAIWGAVKARMDRLSKPAKDGTTAYDHIEDTTDRILECARDAAALECRTSIQERAREACINRGERRNASQPDPMDRRAKAAADVGDTPVDYAWALLASGKSGKEAQQLVNQRFG